MIKTYFSLTKPGIIMGNAITAAAGFCLASKGHFDFWLFVATLVGLSCIIGSACVFNNYIDRDIDVKMERTKMRALVIGALSDRNAIVFALILGALGSFVLFAFTNYLATLLALTGFFAYVVLYGIGKRSVHGTLIGSISGAMPPVVGYCAVSTHIDLGAIILFLMVVLWQMPHFYAIALYRLDDYAAASIPVLPLEKGIQTTKIHMLLYVGAFTIASMMLTVYGYTGYAYLVVATLIGLYWLMLSVKGFTCDNDTLWARQMFRFSLIAITLLSLMIIATQ